MSRSTASLARRALCAVALLLCAGQPAAAQLNCINPTKITQSTGIEFGPVWNPASETIAYTILTGSVQNVGSVRADGTLEGPMATGPNAPFGIGQSLSWVGSTGLLMTNEQVVFHEYMTFNSSLAPFTRTVSDGNDAAFTRKLLIPGGGGGGLIRVSRSGGTVLWQHNDTNNSGLNQIRVAPFSALTGQNTNAVGTRLVPLDRTGFYVLGAALTPSGAQFVISKPSGAGHDLFLHNSSDGALVRQLTTSGASVGADNRGPDVSPDGTKVAFGSNYNGAGGLLPRFNLFLINLDGTGLTNITNSTTFSALEPSFSPDGQRLAFRGVNSTDVVPNNDIYVCTLASVTPMLSLNPAQIKLSGTSGGGTERRVLQVAASGGSVSWEATATMLNGAGWLLVSPPSGTATPTQSSVLNADVNLSALTQGFFQGAITVRNTATNATATVQVRVTVTAGGQAVLQLSRSSLVFRMPQGGLPPPAQILRVLNSGAGSFNWAAALPSLPGFDVPSPATGIAAGASPGSAVTFGISAAASAIAAGVYQIALEISAPTAANNPQQLTLTLHVVPSGTPAKAELATNGLIFVAQQGGPNPPTQPLTVSNGGSGTFTFSYQAVSETGNWLAISQPTGSVSGSSTVQASVNIAGLNPGIHRAKVTGTFSGGPAQQVDALLALLPAAAVAAQSGLPGANACTPANMDFVMTTLGSGVSLPVSFPRTLLAEVVDNCGTAVNGATVVVSVEGRSIVLAGVGGGLYSGDWTPDQESAAVPVSAVASHPAYSTVQRAFTVATSAAAGGVVLPVLAPDGVVEGAGFTSLRPLAPGGIISIFGSRFAAGDNSAAVVPLPRSLGGVSVRIGNEDAPLYYAGPGQINAQVPVSVRTGENVSVLVSAGGRITAPQSYPIAPAQPGIFKSGEFAAVLDSQFRAINASNPARLGDTLQIFSTGLGLTEPAAVTGEFSPSFSNVQNPVTVTIGGVAMPVAYQGLAPGYVGLYQINAVLTGIAPGAHAVVLQQNGVASNASLPVSIPVQ